jgi:hypothetical protein
MSDVEPERGHPDRARAIEDPAAGAASARAQALGRVAQQLRAITGLPMLVMLVLSWPLWVEPSDFPRVPLAPRLPQPPAAVSWVLFAVLLGSIAAATAGIAWRAALGLSVAVLGLLILGDQQRFQAWVYQFGMIALLLAALRARDALGLVRWWYVATYAYSGLSKLDAAFCRELGGSFLSAACGLAGINNREWPTAMRTGAILAMPGWELAVALWLSIPQARRLGRAGAVALHGALLLILGPWGMGHSTIVQVWNAAMAVEVWVAFGAELGPRSESIPMERELNPAWGWLARLALAIGIVMPLGEGLGYFDAWPAHALYASHGERTEVYVHEDDLGGYSPAIRRHVGASGPGPWRRLDLTGWSRELRGVPVYPQARTCNSLAEALAARYGDRRLIRVVHWSRADRWTARRTQVAALGLEEIRRQGETYWLNAHPARPLGPEGEASQAEGQAGTRPSRSSRP